MPPLWLLLPLLFISSGVKYSYYFVYVLEAVSHGAAF